MNRQQYDLLITLMYSPGISYTQKELADSMAVGLRSIRNYIAGVNHFLLEHDVQPLYAHPNGDIFFAGTQKDVLKISNAIFQSDFYQYRLSAEERVQILIFLLLTADDYLTSKTLANQLYVSKSTLMKDMEAVGAYFSSHNVPFAETKQQGYRLNITEELRRYLLLKNVNEIIVQYCFLRKSIGVATGVIYGFLLHLFDRDFSVNQLKVLVCRAEIASEVRLNDREYQSIVYGLLVILSRISHGCLPPDESPSSGVASRLASAICQELSKDFSHEILPREQAYIAYALDHYWLDRKDSSGKNALELHLITKQFIYSVSKDIMLELFNDDQLQIFLVQHLLNVSEWENQYVTDESLSSELKSYYSDVSQAVDNNLPILEDALHHSLDQNTKNSILVHITAAVERFRRNQGAPKVILVCNAGVATANFISEKLHYNFNIDIVGIISAHRLPQMKELLLGCDFIITTVPLQLEDIPCIWVSPILTRKDMYQIYDTLSTFVPCSKPVVPPVIKTHALESSSSSFPEQIFSAENVEVNCFAATWQEAIRVSGNLLHLPEKEQYIHDMIQAVEDNGPYIVIVPGIALAHAIPPHPDVPFRASMAWFRKPILFHSKDNDPVRCVISLQSTNKKEQLDKLFYVMHLICCEDFRKFAQKATKEELLAYLEAYQEERSRD